MKKALIAVFIFVMLSLPLIVAAHSGGTNASGCHYVWINGIRVGYHCHYLYHREGRLK